MSIANPSAAVFFAGLGVVFLLSVVLWARQVRARRRAARAPDEQQREWRVEFLSVLVQLVGHDTAARKTVGSVRRQLAWRDEGRFSLVLDYLAEKGLVAATIMGGASQDELVKKVADFFSVRQVRITSAGLDEIRRARITPTEHLPRIDIRDSNITIASPGSTQVLHKQGLEPAEVAAFIHMYRDALQQPNALAHDQVRDACRLLGDLQQAIDEADKRRATRVGRTLRSIAEGVAGNVTFVGVVAAAKALGF